MSILNKEQSVAYYYNLKKKKIEKYYLNKKWSSFSGTFFQQLTSFKQDKQEFKKLPLEDQKIIEDFIKKNRLRRSQIIIKKNNKELVLTSKKETIPDFLRRFLQGLKEDKTARCIFCNHKGGLPIKGWLFPFIIEKDKLFLNSGLSFPLLPANATL